VSEVGFRPGGLRIPIEKKNSVALARPFSLPKPILPKLTGVVPVGDLGHRAQRRDQEGQREQGGAEDGVHSDFDFFFEEEEEEDEDEGEMMEFHFFRSLIDL